MTTNSLIEQNFYRLLREHGGEAAVRYMVNMEGENIKLPFLIHHEPSLQAFARHVQKEYSGENIDFWLEVREYQQLSNVHRQILRESAEALIARYVSADAPNQVNIDADARIDLIQAVESDNFDNTTFNQAQNIVFDMMNQDTFIRFQRSDVFADLIKDIQQSNGEVGQIRFAAWYSPQEEQVHIMIEGVRNVDTGGKECNVQILIDNNSSSNNNNSPNNNNNNTNSNSAEEKKKKTKTVPSNAGPITWNEDIKLDLHKDLGGSLDHTVRLVFRVKDFMHHRALGHHIVALRKVPLVDEESKRTSYSSRLSGSSNRFSNSRNRFSNNQSGRISGTHRLPQFAEIEEYNVDDDGNNQNSVNNELDDQLGDLTQDEMDALRIGGGRNGNSGVAGGRTRSSSRGGKRSGKMERLLGVSEDRASKTVTSQARQQSKVAALLGEASAIEHMHAIGTAWHSLYPISQMRTDSDALDQKRITSMDGKTKLVSQEVAEKRRARSTRNNLSSHGAKLLNMLGAEDKTGNKLLDTLGVDEKTLGMKREDMEALHMINRQLGAIRCSTWTDEGKEELHVLISECKDLVGPKRNGLADVRVKCTLIDPDTKVPHGQKLTTRCINDTLTPRFDDHLIFKLESPTDLLEFDLQITIFSKQLLVKDIKMGRIFIRNLENLPIKRNPSKWLYLYPIE